MIQSMGTKLCESLLPVESSRNPGSIMKSNFVQSLSENGGRFSFASRARGCKPPGEEDNNACVAVRALRR